MARLGNVSADECTSAHFMSRMRCYVLNIFYPGNSFPIELSGRVAGTSLKVNCMFLGTTNIMNGLTITRAYEVGNEI
jgi:hypothetical protein